MTRDILLSDRDSGIEPLTLPCAEPCDHDQCWQDWLDADDEYERSQDR